MNKIAVRKSDNKMLSFGTENMSRFSPKEFDIMETALESLPDELDYCFWDYKKKEVVVDEVLKQETQDREEEIEKKRQEAREYIEKNSPADVNSVPALIERVKRLEALLGIYKWL